MEYKVVLELELDALGPLEAAKKAEEWVRDHDTNLQYYVQECNQRRILSVDLSETDAGAVQEMETFVPLIGMQIPR